ncbi:hypothetical protein GTU79_17235 [Sodalis ligni]|nr:hypothetical protein [Sodalis ligni]QWA09181.1 hypothetical protein GTU79_17235 [Sodalis ligni]
MLAAPVIWRMSFRFDVLALGRDIAVSLDIDYRHNVTVIFDNPYNYF